MADIATAAQPTDFFASAKSARVGVRSLWSKLLSGICVGLALLTLVPLFSIVFLVLKNGLPLLSWRVFTELPPAAGMTGGGFGNAVVGTVLMVGIALVLATPFGVLSAIYINEYEPFSALSNAVDVSTPTQFFRTYAMPVATLCFVVIAQKAVAHGASAASGLPNAWSTASSRAPSKRCRHTPEFGARPTPRRNR